MTTPYGAWPSPLSASDVAAGTISLSWPRLVGDEVWWTEGRPAEGGRSVVVRRRDDGSVEDVLPALWNARTRVHEYGGNPWLVANGALVFVHFADQRLWRLVPGGEPAPLTPDGTGDRYAELVEVGAELWCVRERHDGGAVSRALVAVPLDGSGKVRELVTDRHFLAHPRLSPDGRHLAWIGWEHPQMPWDGTELRVAAVSGGQVGEPRTLLGDTGTSVLQPEWLDDTTLLATTDASGWWNLVRVPLDGPVTPLHPAEQEFAGPLWALGSTWSALLADGRVAALHGGRLGILDSATMGDGGLRDLALPFSSCSSLHSDGQRLVTVASSPTSPSSVVVVDPDGGHEVVHVSAAAPVDAAWLPVPSRQTFPSARGRVVHALVYPPTSPQAAAPQGELPPYVVVVHGGPTSQASDALDLRKAYFTSRGIGVIDVDYGGSTGYGRPYRDALRGQWGVVDVEDAVAAARGLADAGQADPARLLIRGGSAGGWTVLAALTRTDAFAAGASYYGVGDALALARDTHDFESRYLDGLVGPLPDALELYAERSPLSHVDGLSCPVLLLQGAEDEVVPPAQAELFRDALLRKQIPHAYLLFPGEQHGFRRAENIVTSLEAELSLFGQAVGFIPAGVPELQLVR